jgi:hypothetical protein
MSGNTGGWLAGVAAAVVAAWIIAEMGIEDKTEVTIEGPTTAPYGNGVSFILVGHVNGSYDWAYWTDTFGRRVTMSDTGDQFLCPSVGSFTVTLTATNDGDQAQARHTVNCYNAMGY